MTTRQAAVVLAAEFGAVVAAVVLAVWRRAR